MKTKIWIGILAAALVLCLGLSIWLWLPRAPAACAEVYCRGVLLHRLDLSVDREVAVSTELGTNVITVRDGAVAVTQADCPDGYCMKRGFCRSGAQIVCLPHGIVIQFVGSGELDGVAG